MFSSPSPAASLARDSSRCGPCKQMMPEMKKAATALKADGIKVAAIDGQVSPHLAQQREQAQGLKPKWTSRAAPCGLLLAACCLMNPEPCCLRSVLLALAASCAQFLALGACRMPSALAATRFRDCRLCPDAAAALTPPLPLRESPARAPRLVQSASRATRRSSGSSGRAKPTSQWRTTREVATPSRL